MTKPAFIVEGQTEKLFLSSVCAGSPIRTLELNGKDVALDAIIGKIESLSVLLKGRFSPIVVVFDREDRELSADGIAQKVADALSARRPSDRYVIGVADRMIENWILADWESLRVSIPELPATQPRTEGINGKAHLRSLLGARGYSATIDGPKLLRKARASFVQRTSSSFGALKRQLSVPCRWLSQ